MDQLYFREDDCLLANLNQPFDYGRFIKLFCQNPTLKRKISQFFCSKGKLTIEPENIFQDKDAFFTPANLPLHSCKIDQLFFYDERFAIEALQFHHNPIVFEKLTLFSVEFPQLY
jgi:hypothetical protein